MTPEQPTRLGMLTDGPSTPTSTPSASPCSSTPIDAADAPTASGGYAQARLLEGASRWLFVSGQIPETRDGTVPATFDAQAELVWKHVLAQVAAAGMGVDNLVKVTTFLAAA